MASSLSTVDLDLKAIRRELGVSQNGLADLVGRRVQTISMWEQKRGPVPKPIVFLITRIIEDHRRDNAEKAAA